MFFPFLSFLPFFVWLVVYMYVLKNWLNTLYMILAKNMLVDGCILFNVH